MLVGFFYFLFRDIVPLSAMLSCLQYMIRFIWNTVFLVDDFRNTAVIYCVLIAFRIHCFVLVKYLYLLIPLLILILFNNIMCDIL